MTPSQNPKKVPYRFGEKIRQARERKGYTLKVVAQKAGVSESLVSQIERNRVSPAIDTLLSLADVLEISLEYLFEEYRKSKPVKIIRGSERASVTEDNVIYEELARPEDSGSGHEDSVEAYMLKIPVGGNTHRGSYGHLGREIGIIQRGKALLKYDEEEYIVSEGDSVSYSASNPHELINIGDVPLEAIWVITPAQRFQK